MMFKIWKIVFVVLFFATVSVVLAQPPKPTVAVVLNQLTAQMGDSLSVAVEVRGGVNIAGTDIGIKVDPTCLRITDRQTGEYLPTEAEKRGFSAFSELHDHDTRLAASLLKDGPIANGDGVFFRAKLEVTCETGIAPIEVTFVELTSIEDPAAQNRKFVAYRLDKGEVNVVNAQLAIGPQGQVTAVAANTPDGQLATIAPTTPQGQSATATLGQVAGTTQSPVVPVVLIVLTVAGVALLIVVIWFMRRRSKDEDQE